VDFEDGRFGRRTPDPYVIRDVGFGGYPEPFIYIARRSGKLRPLVLHALGVPLFGASQQVRVSLRFRKLGPAESAASRSTAALYSNAIDFHQASLLSNAQVAAHTDRGDRDAPSSQRGSRGSSPLSSTDIAVSKTLSGQRGPKAITPPIS
jgi:hypothetical protein